MALRRGVLTVGSLFAGIGGFDLGLERAGMRTVWLCEQDAYCQRVLAKHWPGVPCHPDVRALVADTERGGFLGAIDDEREHVEARTQDRADPDELQRLAGERDRVGLVPVPVPSVDVLCGGFPCQDLSYAGKGAGINGERSGLWAEYARLIRELRPQYVIVENVSALLTRGMERVLGDLAACGYDAEWDCIPASAVGAPHRRDRVWIVAYPDGAGRGERRRPVAVGSQQPAAERGREDCPYCAPDEACGLCAGPGIEPVADAGSVGRDRWSRLGGDRRHQAEWGGAIGDARHDGHDPRCDWWLAEPGMGRVAHGVPARVDRLRSLGNALVPQIAEWIGRRILEYEAMTPTSGA